jgi:carboxypeptidase PM20D1
VQPRITGDVFRQRLETLRDEVGREDLDVFPTRLPRGLRSVTLLGWRLATKLRGAFVRRTTRIRSRGGPRAEGNADTAPRLARSRRWRLAIPALLIGALVGVIGLMTFKTLTSRSKQPAVNPVPLPTPRHGYAERLGRALQFHTTAEESKPDGRGPLADLREFLKAEFPVAHRRMELEVFGGHTLVFRWRGTDPFVEPVLLMSHLDVVPVEPGTEEKWTYPPFAGRVADGFIWGRGALDVKCGALGLLEAAELLLARGFRPSGDVYFALGHDEETGGREGNARAAEALRGRGVHFRLVLDEGGWLTEGIIDGIGRPIAFVGIAEKGYATIRIAARGERGHSSMPPPHTAVGMVAAAIARLESDPFPARIDGATVAMLDFLGPELPLPWRVALANRWLTGGLITRQFGAKPSLNALIRTTTAATSVRGGETENVLPEHADALVNVRLLPGDSSDSALRRIRDLIRTLGFDDQSLLCSLDHAQSEPSRVSSIHSRGFRTLRRTIAEVYPNAVVAPGLSMIATDSRHYAPIAADIYRFLPLRVTGGDLERIHGVDERIGIETYGELIGFLIRFIENLSAPDSASP